MTLFLLQSILRRCGGKQEITPAKPTIALCPQNEATTKEVHKPVHKQVHKDFCNLFTNKDFHKQVHKDFATYPVLFVVLGLELKQSEMWLK